MYEHEGTCKEATADWVRKQFQGPGYAWRAAKKEARNNVEEIVATAQGEHKTERRETILFG